MVYAAGNYTTAQFIKFGIPLQIIQFITVTIIFYLRPWKWILCGASVLLLVVVGAGVWLINSGLTPRTIADKIKHSRAKRSGILVEEEVGAGVAAAPKAV